MVKCMVCSREFNRITKTHLKKHEITLEEYQTMYPLSSLICEESRVRYSNATKQYFETIEEGEKLSRYKNRVYSDEGKKKRLETLKHGRQPHIYLRKERNEAISKAKKEWWKAKNKEERSTFIREKVVPAVRAKLGEEAYRAQLREKGIKGYQAVTKKGTEKKLNNFEQEMVAIISNKGYECITQFEINKWFFDCYIPEKNLIIEFDGDYWHPETLEDCVNKRLKRQWNIDRKKEEIARQQGYSLIRIRESNKELLLQFI